jgi:GNAT superfamily N-acetyltransferase
LIEIRRATDADADGVADVFIESFRNALPTVHRPHAEDDIRGFVRNLLIPEHECWVAVDADRVVGMMALKPGWVEQLYIATDRIGEGIGHRLLDLAKDNADDELQLWTFQVNDRARRFYERNGFEPVELTDGAGNEEREPDVRYLWRRDAAS